ncbi:MAG TPA: hypothetical protein VNN79_23060, partial [Actinomycetota bacterium]|nr:hypothetical protein [Actinomycetota bacterium]
ATQGGLFRSAHGANRWAPLRRGLPGVPTGVVVAGKRGVLAGTYTPGVFLRSAGRWIPSNSGIPIEYPGRTFRSRDLASLAVAPSDRDVVYAGTFAQGLFRSANGGRSWKSVTRRDLGDMTIAVDPGDPDHLFVASFEGLFESGDGGATLQPRTAGLPPRHDAITSVAFDSGDSTIVYGGGPHGVWLSSDGGGHWHRTTEGLDHRWLDPVRVFADPRHAGVVYVVDSLGVARSTDAGTHWTRLAGSPTDARSLAFDAARPRTLYVGVAKQPGVLISRDGGGTWHFLLGGCGCSSVESLAVAGSGGIRTLYAASSTGVYEVTLPN